MSLTDTYISYKIIKLLSIPFEEWKAYKLGLIDDKGKLLKKPETTDEKNALPSYARIILKIKRAITKLTGQSRAAAIISTIVLLKDNYQNPVFGYILKEEVVMPAELVKSLSKKAGISIERGEKLWKQAKEIVKKEYTDIEEGSDKYYQLVVGVLKNSMGLKEASFAATLPALDQPIKMRYPDGDSHGIPYFDVDLEDMVVTNILNGREKYKRWREFIKDRGIHMWANKTFKPFSVRTQNGIFLRMR